MRKHLSLIVEHDDEEMVGLIKSYDSRKATLTKNESSEIHKFDEDSSEFSTVGTEVGLGYVDFEDPQREWGDG